MMRCGERRCGAALADSGWHYRYRPVLLTVATANSKTLADPSELWGAMQQMKAEIVTLLRDGNDGVRTSVLKFLELQVGAFVFPLKSTGLFSALTHLQLRTPYCFIDGWWVQILAQTLRTAASETKKGDTSGLEVVPADHPVLNAATLRVSSPMFSCTQTSVTATSSSTRPYHAVLPPRFAPLPCAQSAGWL